MGCRIVSVIRRDRYNIRERFEEGISKISARMFCKIRACFQRRNEFLFIGTNKRNSGVRKICQFSSLTPTFHTLNLTGPNLGELDFGHIRLTKASPGLMVVLCEGRRGGGFYICGQCGAGFREAKSPHENPYGENCPGTLERVSLGHEFITDVLQIRFFKLPQDNTEGIWFAYSLAYALVEGAAEILEVPPIDLKATVAY